MKRILYGAVVMTLVLGVPTFAASNNSNKSSNDAGKGEIGFGIAQTDLGSDTTGIDSAQFLGLRGGYNFNKQWQIEGQFGSSSESGDVLGTSVDTSMQLLMVNAVRNFHPRKEEFVPYVMAGLGRVDADVEAGGIKVSDNAVAYQIGAGTRIYFGQAKRMAFRTDVSLMRESTFDDSSTMTSITGGLTFKLGR